MSDTNPDLIYHYTDCNGLLGILKFQQLWLTHHSFLNDTKELQYGIDLINEFAPENKHLISMDSYNQWIDELEARQERIRHHTYVACFSQNGDQLSQWRAYGDNGGGFAIGFRLSELDTAAGNAGWCSGPDRVIYDSQSQRNLINRSFKEGYHLEGDEVFEFWDDLLDEHIVYFKDAAFSEEVEWRMATICVAENDPEVPQDPNDVTPDFRLTKYGIAPYVRLGFPTCAVSEIIVGPKCTMREKHWVIRQILRQAGFDGSIRIANSIVSYR